MGLVAGPGSYENPQLSPDGRWIAVCRKEGGQHDIWVVDVERNVPTRRTTDAAVDDFPVWSPDGRHVIFASNRKGVFDRYRRAAQSTVIPDRGGDAASRDLGRRRGAVTRTRSNGRRGGGGCLALLALKTL